MAIDQDLQNLENRAFRYDAQDGLTELLAGTMFFLVSRTIGSPHLAWVPGFLVFPMLMALRFFKQRITWPRIGYVKLRSEKGSDFGRGVLAYLGVVILTLATCLWLFSDITSWDAWRRWLPVLIGGFCSGAFVNMARRSRFWRHWLLALFSVGWGVACSVMDSPSSYEGLRRWALGLGLVSLVVGTVVLVIFVRTHPVRSAEARGDQA
mgnify:CR=1 FL=1|tara:strand:- start:33346 stop:33969 length:624 start_codon:yes stop_codon:yes gene_type:complete